MVNARRDNRLIDALEAIEPVHFKGSVWRLVRDGRNPLQCSASGGPAGMMEASTYCTRQ